MKQERGSYQNPSIVELRELVFELENKHEEDPARDDTTVLDQQRSLGHCGKTTTDIRDRDLIRHNTFIMVQRSSFHVFAKFLCVIIFQFNC